MPEISVFFASLTLAVAVPSEVQPTVSGTVLDGANRPIVGAQVELLLVPSNVDAGRLRLDGRHPEPAARARSDAAGRFLLQAPGVGVFKVLARSDGRVPMQYAPVPLVEDEELPPVVLSPDIGCRLHIADSLGRPLAGAWAFAASAVESDVVSAGDGWHVDLRTGRTSADGSLTLPRLLGEKLDVSVFPPGGVEEKSLDVEQGAIAVDAGRQAPYRLRVFNPDGRPAEGVLVRIGDLSWPVGLTDAEGRLAIPRRSGEPAKLRLAAPDGHGQGAELPANAGPGEEVPVVLAAPQVVSGRVTSGAMPIAGALVRAVADPGAFVITDANGLYRLVAPASGFQLQAVAPRHLPGSVRLTSVHVRSGRAPAVALAPAVAVRGQVVDTQGALVAGVTVAAVPELGPGLPEAVTDRASSDAAGRFELRGMRAGRSYEMRALRPGYLPAVAHAVAPVPSREAPPLKIVLTLARAAQGRVRDVEGRPVAGAEVSLTASRAPGRAAFSINLTGEPPEEGIRTDERGKFTVIQMPANPVDVTVRKRGYAPAIVRGVRVPPGAGPADLGVVVLRPGVALIGRVADREDQPIARAEVFLVGDLKHVDEMRSRLKGDLAAAVTNPDGRFAIEDLPARSPVNLLVRARGFQPAAMRGARAANREPLAVRLQTATVLRGRVIDEARQPVPSARLELTVKVERPLIRSAVSGRDGHFEIPDAPPGSGALSVQAHGFVPIEDLEVSLPRPEPRAELVLTLEKGAILTGRVSLTDGSPVPGARISAAGTAALSDDDGAYNAEGVALGAAVVTVFHPSYRRFSKEMVIEPGINQLNVTFEPGVEVTGRVVAGRGAPVPGAWVQLTLEPRGELQYRARAATDGTFRLSPVARGRYRLRAGHGDYAPAELTRLVVVTDEPVGDLEVALLRGGAISGRVLGLQPEELYQVEVAAESAGKTYPATLDAEGRYEVRRLEPGDYLVRASLLAGQRQAQARVSLEPGQGEAERDLEFVPRLTLSGQVFYGEEPLPEAALTVRGNHIAVERSAVTDYRGGFRIEDLEPGIYSLGLSHLTEHLVHNEQLELVVDREIVIQLRVATVSGLVNDGQSGGPIPGALILLRHVASVESPEFVISGGTEEDGNFLLSRVPPGTYRLTISAQGYAPVEQEVAVRAGQDVAGLEVALEPTRGLDLTVRLASGKVPKLVHIRILAPSGAPVVAESRSPDRFGALRLATVPEGSWHLLLGARGGAVVGNPVTVPGEPIAVTLPEAGSLRVRVPTLAATDLVARLSLRGSDQQPFWTLGPGGTVRDQWQVVAGNGIVEGLPAGLWQIWVEAPDGNVWTRAVTTLGISETGIVLE